MEQINAISQEDAAVTNLSPRQQSLPVALSESEIDQVSGGRWVSEYPGTPFASIQVWVY